MRKYTLFLPAPTYTYVHTYPALSSPQLTLHLPLTHVHGARVDGAYPEGGCGATIARSLASLGFRTGEFRKSG